MRRDNLNDFLAFIAVAREGSFTKAAAKLGVSQSARDAGREDGARACRGTEGVQPHHGTARGGNPLFYKESTRMFYGDAKKSLDELLTKLH